MSKGGLKKGMRMCMVDGKRRFMFPEDFPQPTVGQPTIQPIDYKGKYLNEKKRRITFEEKIYELEQMNKFDDQRKIHINKRNNELFEQLTQEKNNSSNN